MKYDEVVKSPKSAFYVIPAQAGIQPGQWMPDQVRHDAFAYLIAGLVK